MRTDKPLRALFADHYWDSFEDSKDIIMKHVDFVLSLYFADPPVAGAEVGVREALVNISNDEWNDLITVLVRGASIGFARSWRKRFEKLRAALSPPVAERGGGGAWEPIETAPKDKNVLVVHDLNFVSEAYYNGETDAWWLANTAEHDFDSSDAIYPTLWQLLPDAPGLLTPTLETGDGSETSTDRYEQQPQKCAPCSGTGRYMGRFGHNDPACPNCDGTGWEDRKWRTSHSLHEDHPAHPSDTRPERGGAT